MLMDINLRFSNAQAITATAASTLAYDQETGNSFATSFTNPNDVLGNATYFGEDLGLGRGIGTPKIVGTTGATAWATGTSLRVQFEGAPDNVTAHASLLRSDLTFVPYIATDLILTALLLANTRIFSFSWPKRKVGQATPRFVQLNYIVAGSNFTAATITSDVTLGPDDALGTLQQFAANY